MKRLISELRRRKVFRSIGIYIGVALAVIEAANNILPVFDAPDWTFKFVTIGMIALFPVVIAAAWHFDFTSQGILTDEEAARQAEAADPLAMRKKDFAVIAFLVIALSFSLYMNFTRKGGPIVEAIPDPVSILIADFNNETGETIFSGTLEQSLALGLEGAPFISSFSRDTARQVAEQLKPGATLDGAAAQLVAVREGIKMVLQGYIKPEGSGYLMGVSAVNTETNEEVVNSEVKARDRAAVLSAIGELATAVRKELGDVSADGIEAARETFTAGSLEAAHLYLEGKDLSNHGEDDKAIEKYKLALEADPKFGRVYAGWANSAHRLGRQDESQQAWEKALELLDSMTPREKYRTLGNYYLSTTGNYAQAIESFNQLVERYPADDASYNNLAVAYFLNLQFPEAMDAGRKALAIYPKIAIYRGNYALYSMYAGDFTSAIEISDSLMVDLPGFYVSYLARAVSLAVKDELDKADADYQAMSGLNAQSASLAALGRADLLLYQGKAQEAVTLLNGAIESDLALNYASLANTKLITRARAQRLLGDHQGAMTSLAKVLELHPSAAKRALVALEYVALGEYAKSDDVAQPLKHMLQAQSRAWWSIAQGERLMAQGDLVTALDELDKAIGLADLWLARLAKGKAYVKAGYHAEALAELETCLERHGEATAILLDDQPSLNYLPELYYWMSQAQWGLGMKEAATSSMETFLAHREGLSDPMSEEGRLRMALP
ncbi:MAG: tetratricopeptide repeat protein [Gammaproteobacteria bacterium]|nr:tetratricopeptide repeat protein [Gammaproteobacteria bacterium]